MAVITAFTPPPRVLKGAEAQFADHPISQIQELLPKYLAISIHTTPQAA